MTTKKQDSSAPPIKDGPFFLGIDLGGTNVKAGVVAECGTPMSKCTTRTNAAEGPVPGVRRMCEVGADAIRDAGLDLSDISAVGVATPGTMDIPGGMLLLSLIHISEPTRPY